MISVRWLFLCAATIARAQDPFEIHVYEYEPLPVGAFTYESHLNYVLEGTRGFDGTVAPTRHQFHFTSEVTAGLGESFALGAMLLTAERPDHALEYAGWRVLPHVFAPKSWNLPIRVGLLAEFSFQRTTYEENSRRVELRLILERHIGRLQLDGNPVFERALHGPGTSEGWVFTPSGRIGWQQSKTWTPSVEYYSSWGPLRNLPALHEQIHQIVPGADWKISEHLECNFGVGFGATDTGNRVFLKSRLQWTFGRKAGLD
jgi:hypothetical protein